MLTGLPPFYDENTNEMYRKILQEPLHFPGPEVVPSAARDLLTKLLDRNPERRLGANGAAEIKAHAFFANIDWRKLLQRKYEPSFKPNVVCLPLDSYDSYSGLIHSRLMRAIPPISIVNLHPKHQRIHMWKGPCSLKQCSSNLPDGPTTALSLVLVMLVEA